MDKYQQNTLEATEENIILLNDHYIEKGLKAGYIGVVQYNLVDLLDCVIADFYNPITGAEIARIVDIDTKDFRVLSNSPADQQLKEEYKNLFKK